MLKILRQIFKSFSKTERQIFWGALIIFSSSALMFFISVFQKSTVEMPAESRSYTEGIIGQPIAINPILTGNNDADRDLTNLLFSGLIDLAETYQKNNNGQTWNIILKDNLKWSDGKPLTSDDIIYTIDAIQNSESQSPLFSTWQGVVANRISEREVEFTLRTPYAFFLDNLKNIKIIPKHIFEIIPVNNFHLSNFNLEPVGNGPYVFSSFEKRKNGFITGYYLTTNPYFSKEKPFIRNFHIAFYPNSEELINAFNLKKIDGFGGLHPKNVNKLKLNRQILEKSIPRYYAVFVNKNAKKGLGDSNVIAALNLAVDKQKIIERVFDGKALLVNEPILPIINGYDKSADPGNEFSLEKADGLLEKAGWETNTQTRTREKKIGKQIESLELSIVVPQIPFLLDTVNIIKEDWDKIGIKLNPIILNPTDIANEVIKTRNYQMIIFGNIVRNNPDVFSFWHSSERFYPGLNLSLYENKKVDSLLESIKKNHDEISRNKDLSELQRLISADQPAIFLYSPTYIYVAPKSFGGFAETIIATPANRFDNVNKWHLETNRVFK